MALLPLQMIRFHEDVRPRAANPTFASQNVASTLGLHAPSRSLSLKNSYSLGDLASNGSERGQMGQQSSPVRRSNSQLSSIGSNSLKYMPRYASGRQIYQRQQLDYNIISSEPLHPQPKKLPSYAGLNQGNSSYSMRLQLERQLNNKLRTDRLILRQQEDANPERQWANKIRRAKYLNNVDQVKDLI